MPKTAQPDLGSPSLSDEPLHELVEPAPEPLLVVEEHGRVWAEPGRGAASVFTVPGAGHAQR